MHGNVWEWVEDCYIANYTGAPTTNASANGGARTTGCDTTTNYLPVLRGGAWGSARASQSLRSAARASFSTVTSSFSSNTVGFRLVRDLP